MIFPGFVQGGGLDVDVPHPRFGEPGKPFGRRLDIYAVPTLFIE
jgi:hypothetical protein